MWSKGKMSALQSNLPPLALPRTCCESGVMRAFLFFIHCTRCFSDMFRWIRFVCYAVWLWFVCEFRWRCFDDVFLYARVCVDTCQWNLPSSCVSIYVTHEQTHANTHNHSRICGGPENRLSLPQTHLLIKVEPLIMLEGLVQIIQTINHPVGVNACE